MTFMKLMDLLNRPFRGLRGGMNDVQWLLVKEAFHLTFGALIGAVTIPFPTLTLVLVFVAMLSVLITKEIKEDNVTQKRYKTVFDLWAWVIGFALTASIRFYG